MVVLPPCVPIECGKDFRYSIRKPSPIYTKGKKGVKVRVVPAFTIQAMQHNTVVLPPPKCAVFSPVPPKPTRFKKCYERGEFPLSIEFGSSGKNLSWKKDLGTGFCALKSSTIAMEGWGISRATTCVQFGLVKVPVEKLDYHHYLPMFFEGLAETDYPYDFVVEKGVDDLVRKAPYKVLPVVPQLIIPIKNALSTKIPTVICHVLKCIQMLVTGCDRVGEALVPYYRQILPILNLFKGINQNLGPGVDYTSSRDSNVGDLIEDTLQLMERYGGPDAFINIKYMVPTYESAVLN